MASNVNSDDKFMMYPRFIQKVINKKKRFLDTLFTRVYPTTVMTKRVFADMKRGFIGEHTPLFAAMVVQGDDTDEESADPADLQPTSGD